MAMVSAFVMINFAARFWALPIGLVAGAVAVLARPTRPTSGVGDRS